MINLKSKIKELYTRKIELVSEQIDANQGLNKLKQPIIDLETKATQAIHDYATKHFDTVTKPFRECSDGADFNKDYDWVREFFYDNNSKLGIDSKNDKKKGCSFIIYQDVNLETFRDYAEAERSSNMRFKISKITMYTIVGIPLAFVSIGLELFKYRPKIYKLQDQLEKTKIEYKEDGILHMLEHYPISE